MPKRPLSTNLHFAAALKARRVQLGLSSIFVANAAGISAPTYSNIEKARYLVSLPVYQKLCAVLALSPGKLLQTPPA